MSPIFGGFPFVPGDDDVLTFKAPKWGGKEDIPFIAVQDDFGDIVHGILLEPEKWNGKFVQAVSEITSADEMVKAFERATEKKARFEVVPWEDMETYGMKAIETVKCMFGFCQYSGGKYYGVPTENETSGELKKAAHEAQGKSGADGKLMTLERWFKREFGS
jgi:hypothetical protein